MTRSPEPPREPDSRSPGRPESKRLRVGVIFGGRSGEHEVSLASAASVLAAIDTTRYDVIPMGIARDGQWLISSGLAAGDQVIVSGLQKVRESEPAKATPWKPDAAPAGAPPAAAPKQS